MDELPSVSDDYCSEVVQVILKCFDRRKDASSWCILFLWSSESVIFLNAETRRHRVFLLGVRGVIASLGVKGVITSLCSLANSFGDHHESEISTGKDI